MSDGRVYVYGSYDDREDRYCSDRYRVVSSADLKQWTVHPVAFSTSDVTWSPEESNEGLSAGLPRSRFLVRTFWQTPKKDLARLAMSAVRRKPSERLLYAPDAIERDGRYYLYFCLSDGSEGVASADRPEGPFRDAVRLPATGIDPAVFIDDDGAAYYFWGQIHAHGARLNDDMMSLNPSSRCSPLLTEEEHFFHEGSSMRKIGDTYYLVYSCMERGKPTALGYSTSTSPLGPFRYRGIIIDNDRCDPRSWNNHGSIEQVDGRWYVFYHRSTRGSRYRRRLCIEPIHIAEDGSIAEVPMTSQGAGAAFEAGQRIEAFRACDLRGRVRIVPTSRGEALGSIRHGDEATFRYVHLDSHTRHVNVEASGQGIIEVRADGRLVGTVEIRGPGTTRAHVRMDRAGESEVSLRFRRPKRMTLSALTFEDQD